jgi:hypothetical protein
VFAILTSMLKSVAVDRKVPLSRRKREVVSELDASAWLRTVSRGDEPFFPVVQKNTADMLSLAAKVGYAPLIAAFAFFGTMVTEGVVWQLFVHELGCLSGM